MTYIDFFKEKRCKIVNIIQKEVLFFLLTLNLWYILSLLLVFIGNVYCTTINSCIMISISKHVY